MYFPAVFKPTISKPTFSKLTTMTVAILLALSTTVSADDGNNDMEHLTIFGHNGSINDLPGSAHKLSKKDLEKFDYTDIMRTLTSVPGVYVLEEDGYGLRPNIGMRGTGQNRSEKVTIMEDGVLAAPAPYAAPSAYYFPTFGRMEQVEVLKGTSSAMYGPRTTGGVINLLSRSIPEEDFAGQVNLSAGQDGFAKVHAYAGGSGKNVASVFEVFRYQADGFKDINFTNDSAGFVKNDLLTKILFHSDNDAKYYQELEFKLQYSDEDSDDTYMGLTQADFETNPYSRYSASQLDNMATEHKQLQVNHLIRLTDRISVGTTAYYNDFSRNWYKASKINDTSLNKGGIEFAAEFDQGTFGQDNISVDIKANNRNYLSQGIQSVIDADLNDHQLKLGIRLHQDEMDRFQWVDTYQLDSNYTMTQTSAGIPGSNSNRIDSAKALALFAHDEYVVGDFIINTGLRYEDMVIERQDWGKADSARDQTPAYKKNELSVWLPSLALTYRATDDLVIIGGVQKGFAPPAPGNETVANEESINYELGLRYQEKDFNGEALFFYSDYSNMHGNCTASQGCEDDNIGNQYNAGEVEVSGLEVKTGYEFTLGSLAMPIDFTYTYTETEFINSFESDLDTWGDVKQGDELPYVPNNQYQFTIGLAGDNWQADLLVRYMDDMRTTAGTGSVSEAELIASRTVIDMAAHYSLSTNQELTFNVDNLLDEQYVATKTYGSIKVGKPRSLIIGYKYRF